MLIELLIGLIRVSPFIAFVIIVMRLIRALQNRELMAGGGRSPVVKVREHDRPISFWIEIGLHVIAAVFLLAGGLLLTGHAPEWLERLMDE